MRRHSQGSWGRSLVVRISSETLNCQFFHRINLSHSFRSQIQLHVFLTEFQLAAITGKWGDRFDRLRCVPFRDSKSAILLLLDSVDKKSTALPSDSRVSEPFGP